MPLSDILSSPEAQVHDCITSDEPYAVGDWYMAKNIGAIELSKLGEMLGVASYDALHGGFELQGEPLEEGPWPERIPTDLIKGLRALDDDKIEEVVPRWARIEEFRGSAAEDGLKRYLGELRAFLVKNDGPFFLVNGL